MKKRMGCGLETTVPHLLAGELEPDNLSVPPLPSYKTGMIKAVIIGRGSDVSGPPKAHVSEVLIPSVAQLGGRTLGEVLRP